MQYYKLELYRNTSTNMVHTTNEISNILKALALVYTHRSFIKPKPLRYQCWSYYCSGKEGVYAEEQDDLSNGRGHIDIYASIQPSLVEIYRSEENDAKT